MYPATDFGVRPSQFPDRARLHANDPLPLVLRRTIGRVCQLGRETHTPEGMQRCAVRLDPADRRRPPLWFPRRVRRSSRRTRATGRPISGRPVEPADRAFPRSGRAPSRGHRRGRDSPGAPPPRGSRCVVCRGPGASNACARSARRRTTRPDEIERSSRAARSSRQARPRALLLRARAPAPVFVVVDGDPVVAHRCRWRIRRPRLTPAPTDLTDTTHFYQQPRLSG